MSLAQQLLLVPLLIGMNAFFVAAEYALIALRPGQIESLRQRQLTRTVGAIERLRANTGSAIGAIQVCITMTNLLLGWIAEPAMTLLLELLFAPLVKLSPRLMAILSTTVGFVVVTLLTVVFSELLPKALTLQYAAAAAVMTAWPILQLQRLLQPLVWVMNGMANLVTKPLGLGDVNELEHEQVTLEEVKALTEQAAAAGTLSARERSVIFNALTLGRRRASEIMIHRSRVQWLDVNRSMADNRIIVDQALHSRFPLCDGDLDRTLGVVKAKEFLTALHAGGESAVLGLIATAPAFLPQTISLDQLLKAFYDNRTDMIILVSEYGAVEGIVTLRDVMDELVNDPPAVQQSTGVG